jgi:aarF domain-containing kinase
MYFFVIRSLGTDDVHGVAGAAILSAIDYKITMLKIYGTANTEHDAYSECHTRSAKRVLKALLANGGSD